MMGIMDKRTLDYDLSRIVSCMTYSTSPAPCSAVNTWLACVIQRIRSSGNAGVVHCPILMQSAQLSTRTIVWRKSGRRNVGTPNEGHSVRRTPEALTKILV